MIRAALAFRHAGYGTPVLVGREERIRATMQAAGLGAPEGLEITMRGSPTRNKALYRLPLPPPAAQGRALPRLPAHGEPGPQRLRRLHGGRGRRRCHGDGRDPQLLHHAGGDPPGARPQARPYRCSASRSCIAHGRTVLLADTTVHELPSARGARRHRHPGRRRWRASSAMSRAWRCSPSPISAIRRARAHGARARRGARARPAPGRFRI